MARTRVIDHFPFLVPHGTITEAGFTLATVMKWYWLVSRWTLKMTVSGTVSGTFPYKMLNEPTQQIPISLTLAGASETTNVGRIGINDETGRSDETCLISGPPVGATDYYDILSGYCGGSASASGTLPDGAAIYGNGATVFDFYLGGGGFSMFTDTQDVFPHAKQAPLVFDPSSGLYRPTLSVGAVAGGIAVGGSDYTPSLRLAVQTGVLVTAPGFNYQPTVALAIPVYIEGQYYGTVPGYYQYNQDFSDETLNVTDLVYRIAIDPAAYWSYTGEDGIALYASDTGLPLINPATGKTFTLPEIVAMPVP